MKGSRKIKYRGKASEPQESIIFSDYEIRSLKHGNTGNILYQFPSKLHSWENCWTMDLQAAKSGVLKYQEHLKEAKE